MPELVRAQDEEERQGVGQPLGEPARLGEEVDAPVRGPGPRRRRESGEEEGEVEPRPALALGGSRERPGRGQHEARVGGIALLQERHEVAGVEAPAELGVGRVRRHQERPLDDVVVFHPILRQRVDDVHRLEDEVFRYAAF